MKYRKIINIIVVVMLLTACEEKLDLPQQPGVQSGPYYYKSLDGLTQILNASYNGFHELLASNGDNTPHNYTHFNNVRSDDTFVGDERESKNEAWYDVRRFVIQTDNSKVLAFWENLYAVGKYASIVIEEHQAAIDAGESKALVHELVGQAYTLRGFAYFNLARNYGNVPVYTSATFVETPNSNQADVYKQAIADFKEATNYLTLTKTDGEYQWGRIRKGAPEAMMAKAYMYLAAIENSQENYQNAYNAAKECMATGEYNLLSGYDELWNWDNKFTNEAIFEIGYTGDMSVIGTQEYWQCYYRPRYVYKKGSREIRSVDFNNWGHNPPTQDFVDAFETGDPRLHWTVFVQGDSIHTLTPEDDTLEICFARSTSGYYFKKYVQKDRHHATRNAVQNKIYYRYADLLLIAAEAANEIGQTTDALTWLNQVRQRARNTLAAPQHESDKIDGIPADVTTTDKVQLREIIMNERRVELGLEGERFYDLVRWYKAHGLDIKTIIETGIAKDGPPYLYTEEDGDVFRTAGEPRESPYKDKVPVSMEIPKHLLLPIPKAELLANPIVTQNPGY